MQKGPSSLVLVNATNSLLTFVDGFTRKGPPGKRAMNTNYFWNYYPKKNEEAQITFLRNLPNDIQVHGLVL